LDLGGTDFIATNNLAHYNTELIAAVKSLVEDKKALLICPVLSPTGPASFFYLRLNFKIKTIRFAIMVINLQHGHKIDRF
jgi:hypothetical protein